MLRMSSKERSVLSLKRIVRFTQSTRLTQTTSVTRAPPLFFGILNKTRDLNRRTISALLGEKLKSGIEPVALLLRKLRSTFRASSGFLNFLIKSAQGRKRRKLCCPFLHAHLSGRVKLRTLTMEKTGVVRARLCFFLLHDEIVPNSSTRHTVCFGATDKELPLKPEQFPKGCRLDHTRHRA